jgi:hypothetical protein
MAYKGKGIITAELALQYTVKKGSGLGTGKPLTFFYSVLTVSLYVPMVV